MKFNLKNRPFISIFDIISTPISESTFNKIKEYIDTNEAWFEGFEKELRMKLRNAEKQMKSWPKSSPMWFETAYQHGYFVIREILGES